MMQPDEVRRAVEKVLERPMPDVVWSRLNNEDLSHEFAAIGPEGLAREAEHLIGFLAHQRAFQRRGRLRSPKGVGDSADWTQAMSRLFRSHAESREDVASFRKDHLPRGLVSRSGVERRIKRWQREDPETILLTLAVPASALKDYRWDRALRPSELASLGEVWPTAIGTETLSYAVPGDPWERAVSVSPGGVLARLEGLCERLARLYGWDEAQACVFVLAGALPLIDPVKVSFQPRFGLPGAGRASIEVYDSVSAQQLQTAYGKARARWLGPRPRHLSAKHVALVVFGADKPEELTWGEWMSRWNQKYPEHHYKRSSNFVRDYRAAVRRLFEAPAWIGNPKPRRGTRKTSE